MPETDWDFHRKTAVECFNRAWKYLEKKDRSTYDDQLLLHLAHSSRYHWTFVGSPRNLAIGDWQISRAYAAIGHADLALHFAKSSVGIVERNNLVEMVPTVYEAMARAYVTGKNFKLAREFVEKARRELEKAPIEEEDKKIYSGQIKETELMIDSPN